MPPHYLHLYNKPAVGNDFIRRYQAYAYRHKISAMGWFDTASCNLVVPRSEAERWIDQYLGNRVAFYVDNPIEPIWEGLVSRVMYQVGGVTFTVGLDNLYNRVKVSYSLPGSTTVPQQTAAANNTQSQAVYGIKEGSIEAFVIDTLNVNVTQKTTLRDMLLSIAAWPQVSTTIGSSSLAVLSVEFVGFYHTLEWENYQSSSAAAATQPNTLIETLLSGLANGSTFFDNIVVLPSNAAFVMTLAERTGVSCWQKIQQWTEPGDGTNRWISGVSPTSYGTNDRQFYYKLANTNVEYIARLSDALRVRSLYGNVIKPWRVLPDRGVRLMDVLTGWSGLGDDPRECYIEVVDYDAETQQVSWQSSDDITVEGSFQLRRLQKPHGTRFGAVPRSTWS